MFEKRLIIWLVLFLCCLKYVVSTPLSLSECRAKYDKLDYFNTTTNPGEIDKTADNGIPPLLLSYPGAGNTFVRSLLEYATGIHSCSIYLSDKELPAVFPGELTCNRACSVIKGHPTDFLISGSLDLKNRPARNGDKREKLRGTSKFMRRKCAKGDMQHFSNAILLLRDPYSSILSDFQRIVTNSHEGTVALSSNNSYHAMNTKRDPLHLKNITDVWLKVSLEKAKDFAFSMDSVIHPIMMSNYSAPPVGNKAPRYPHLDFSTVTVRFEDLVNKNTRVDTLKTLLMDAFPAARRARMETQRLECAFLLTENRHGIIRKKKLLTLREVYHGIDPMLPCKLSPYLRSFTGNFSYLPLPADTNLTAIQCPPPL